MIRQRLTYGQAFCAVEFANNSNYHLLSLKKKKKELDIIKREKHRDFEKLITATKGQKHLFLIINNEQVLTKKVAFTHIAKESVVKTAFPNIGLNDFYYEVYDNGMSSIVSICRKEVVQNAIDQFKSAGVSVIQFSLGNLSLQKLLPFLNNFHFNTSNAVFEVNDHKIIEWKKSEEVSKSYDVNGLAVSSNELLPLAGILSYYGGLEKSSEEELQNELVFEYRQRRTFQLGVRFGLGALFVLLLINFFVFNSRRNTVADLTAELSLNEVYRKQLLTLNEQVSKKKTLVESMNSVSNSKVIWYFDQIAKTVPKTISLSDIIYQPLTRPARDKKPIVFTTGEIVVKGISKDATNFTNWTAELEKLDWVQKWSTKEYGIENSKQTSFDFIIQMKNE